MLLAPPTAQQTGICHMALVLQPCQHRSISPQCMPRWTPSPLIWYCRGGTLVGRWWPWHPALPQRTIRLGQSVILTLAPRTRALPLSCPPAGVLIGANIVPERNRSWPSPSSILPNFCQHYAFGVQCTVEMHLHHRGASPPERHPTTELKREPASNFYTSALPSGLQLLLKSHSIVTASPQTETC